MSPVALAGLILYALLLLAMVAYGLNTVALVVVHAWRGRALAEAAPLPQELPKVAVQLPVFNEANITPDDKRDIIAYLKAQDEGSPGGLRLGTIGPVAEGMWGWLVALGLIIASTVWIGSRSS